MIWILLCITLFLLIPASFILWSHHKDNLLFMNPGQQLLYKVMWWELLYIVTACIVLLCSKGRWNIEAADIYLLLLCNHVDQMILHYAMGA